MKIKKKKPGHGGPRPNSGRKKMADAKEQRSISCRPDTWIAVDEFANREGVTKNVAVEAIILKGLQDR